MKKIEWHWSIKQKNRNYDKKLRNLNTTNKNLETKNQILKKFKSKNFVNP